MAANFNCTYFTETGQRPLSTLTSKEIRLAQSSKTPILDFKLGIKLTSSESVNWGTRIKKLTSTRHKNSLLRALHGEVYTGERLLRFGLRDSDRCPRCDESESLQHKLMTCAYTERIWDKANVPTP